MAERGLEQPFLLRLQGEEDNQGAEADGSSVATFDWLGRSEAVHNRKLGGQITSFFTIGCICLWFMAYFGIFFNLVLFFSGVFGFGSGTAASQTTNWMGSSFLASLLGSLIAESFLGRLWTCVVFQSIAMMGMGLTMIATKIVLSSGKTTGVRIFFFFSIYLLSIGCGAFQSTLQSLGADQFDVDADKAAFFTRWLIVNNFGLFLADTLVVYVVSAYGWLIGFGLATVLGTGGLILFACGIPFYRQYRHKGNPYQRGLQVLVGAARKWRVALPVNSNDVFQIEKNIDRRGEPLVGHTQSFRWLDKASVFTASDIDDNHVRNVWKLSTGTEVEEMKAVLRLIPIWASSIFFNTIYSQAGTLLVEEGTLMNTNVGGGFTMEPASMNLFNILVIVLVAPLYNAMVVPLARRITGFPRGLSPLHRIGVGYVVGIIAISLAAVVEIYRLWCYDRGLAPPSILWQVPEFILLGFAQFLAGIGLPEFFYTYAPTSLRSLGSALCLTCIAFGSYVSSLLIWLVGIVSTQGGQAGWLPQELNEGHLDYFLWLLGGLGLLNLFWYTACAKSFMRHHSE